MNNSLMNACILLKEKQKQLFDGAESVEFAGKCIVALAKGSSSFEFIKVHGDHVLLKPHYSDDLIHFQIQTS